MPEDLPALVPEAIDALEMLERMAEHPFYVPQVWCALQPREWYCKLNLSAGSIQCHAPDLRDAISNVYMEWLSWKNH